MTQNENGTVTNKQENTQLFSEGSLMSTMAVRVVEFSNGGYKIRKVFA